MKRGSLRFRLLFGAAAFILAALALSAVGLTLLFERQVENWVDAELNSHLDQVIAGIDLNTAGQLAVIRPPADPRFIQPLSGLYWEVAVEPSGPILRSRSLWDYEIPLPAAALDADGLQHHVVAGPDRSNLYLVQRRIELPQRLGGKEARAAVALNASEVRSAVNRFATAIVPLLLILGGLLIAAVWVQVGVGLRPLAAMRKRLEAIGMGSERRLGRRYPLEVQPLASEIDALLDARDTQIEKARARAADLAHGLRTPLQVLLSDAEQLKAKGDAKVAVEIENIVTAMQGHVERQLTRARMATYDPNAKADVGAAIERVVGVMRRTPKGAALSWSVSAPSGLAVRIDAADLAEAIGNLAENAVKHAHTQIAVSAAAEDDHITISFSDDGPGIPLEKQREVLARGVRLDSSGPGSGLGLAIVGDIAEIWGAILSFKSGDADFGVMLAIPRAQPR